jgi:hypothetical protein
VTKNEEARQVSLDLALRPFLGDLPLKEAIMAHRSNLGIKILVCAAMLLALPAAADARGGGGGHGGGGGGGWHGSGFSGWHGSGFAGGGGVGWHGGRGYVGDGYGRFGFYGYGYPYWGYDPYWYGGDYSDYAGYPYAYDPSDVAAPTQPPTAQPAQSYWYFCRSADKYYPYVQSCHEGWQKVLATSPTGPQQNINGPSASTRHPLGESGSAE